jgi:hypothetical protein
MVRILPSVSIYSVVHNFCLVPPPVPTVISTDTRDLLLVYASLRPD